MPIQILMPALSPTMKEGNLAKWLKKEGDLIAPGEVIAEIETDKATMEVESVDEGVLGRIIIVEGTQNVQVNSLIAVLLEEGEDKSALDNLQIDNLDVIDIEHSDEKQEAATSIKHSSQSLDHNQYQISDTITNNSNQRIFVSPLAKRIAINNGINELSCIVGSGPHGRIIKADILKYVQGNSLSKKLQPQRNQQEYKLVPNKNVRKIIAKRLLDAKQMIPHFYLSIECNIDNALSVRQDINSSIVGHKVSVNDFVMMAISKALKNVPQANASWSDEAILYYNNVDISVAVAVEDGLITPIVRNADQKDLITLSKEIKHLATKAKDNKLVPEEFQGGSFTVSNLGMYGIKNFSAIINPPQACILAVGSGSKRAIVIDDKLVIANMMDITLSCDHRVVDGVVGAKLLAAFKKYIEQPILMFI